jgi:hypothetical protein
MHSGCRADGFGVGEGVRTHVFYVSNARVIE